MPEARGSEKPIWASWRITEDGAVIVVATFLEAATYVRREMRFASLDEAARTLGPGFRQVVTRAMSAGSHAGRWRP